MTIASLPAGRGELAVCAGADCQVMPSAGFTREKLWSPFSSGRTPDLSRSTTSV